MARLRNALRWGIALSMVLATITIGATPAVAETDITDLVDKYDENNNGELELGEIQTAIDVWAAGNLTDADGDGSTLDDIQELMIRWSKDN